MLAVAAAVVRMSVPESFRNQEFDRLPLEFIARLTEGLLECRVDKQDRAKVIGDQDRVWSLFERVFEKSFSGGD